MRYNRRRQRARKRNRSTEHLKAYDKQDRLIHLLKNQMNRRYVSLEKLHRYINEAKEEIISEIEVSKERQKLASLKRYLLGLLNEYTDIFFELRHPIESNYNEEDRNFTNYLELYSSIRKFILDIAARGKKMFSSVKLSQITDEVKQDKVKGFKVKTIDKHALGKVRDKLVNHGYIQMIHLSKFRKCFEGKYISERIVWIEKQNKFRYFIRVLINEENNYINSISKKWERALKIFVLLENGKKKEFVLANVSKCKEKVDGTIDDILSNLRHNL